MLEQELYAAKVEKAQEVLGIAFIANDQAAEVAKVGKKTLNLPTALVTSKLSAVLRLKLFAVASVRCNQFDTSVCQLGIQGVTVKSLVTYKSFRFTFDVSRCESFVYQRDFVR
jgi:FAD synthase